jgi:DUF1365 family protein
MPRSCLYEGKLPAVFDGRWLWSHERPNVASFRRRDYLGPVDLPLDEAVRRRVEAAAGHRPEGQIALLTHLRYFGYIFNPVSFYYCFDREGEEVKDIVAEITNTPWHERHAYVLDAAHDEGTGGMRRFRFAKAFHISPFNGMDLDYDWRFSAPREELNVHMIAAREGEPFFDATLRLKRKRITGSALAGALARNPFMTAKVTAMIYWQALRLRLKGAPYHPHPPSGGGEGSHG